VRFERVAAKGHEIFVESAVFMVSGRERVLALWVRLRSIYERPHDNTIYEEGVRIP
jgi:hypothetical protein